jgi:hypothetical protein
MSHQRGYRTLASLPITGISAPAEIRVSTGSESESALFRTRGSVAVETGSATLYMHPTGAEFMAMAKAFEAAGRDLLALAHADGEALA